MQHSLIILITGASSGIGYEAAQILASQGHRVYGAARRVERMEPLRACGVTPITLDAIITTLFYNSVKTPKTNTTK